MTKPQRGIASFDNRETFAVDLLVHLSDVMQASMAMEDCEYMVAAVADRMARDVTQDIGMVPVDPESVHATAELLVEFKRQIGGCFEVGRQTEQSVEFCGRGCPFGEQVKGRPSLCQMTSGVFGRVVADTLGYARVTIAESIARGDRTCKVVVDLKAAGSDSLPTDRATKEYFRSPPISAKKLAETD